MEDDVLVGMHEYVGECGELLSAIVQAGHPEIEQLRGLLGPDVLFAAQASSYVFAHSDAE